MPTRYGLTVVVAPSSHPFVIPARAVGRQSSRVLQGDSGLRKGSPSRREGVRAPGCVAGSQVLIEHYRRLGGDLGDVSGAGLHRNQLAVVRQGDLLLCEELYGCRQAHGVLFPRPMPWLYVVHSGAVALGLEHGNREVVLDAWGDAPNACLSSSATVQLRVVTPDTLLSRVLLPATCRWQPRAATSFRRLDLSLLVPMVRTAFAAAANPPAPEVAKALADNLYRYLREQLGRAGLQLSHDLDPITLLLEHIQVAAEEDLSLSDLAAAACISARRLQELTRERFNLSPMELLRRERLTQLHRLIHDPLHQGVPLSALMRRLRLSDSVLIRDSFRDAFGALPSELRRLNRYGDRLA